MKKSSLASKRVLFLVLILGLLMTISSVYAITGSIGNARMILKAEVGDSIDKTVLVKNVNDVPVFIEMSTSGDLANSIKLKDNNFTLQPGEDKKAEFTIKVTKGGTTESKIDIKFTPTGEKKGVGLSSTIIVVAGNGSIDEGTDTTNSGDDTNIDDNNNNDNNSTSPGITIKNPFEGVKFTPVTIALFFTGLMFVIFILLVIVYYVKSNKSNKTNIQNKNGEKLNRKKSLHK